MSQWIEKDNRLEKTYQFSNFAEAMAWMVRVSYVAESMDHHPVWTNTWNKVHVLLSTHSAGSIVTEKDRLLAQEMDKLFLQLIVQ